MKLLLIDNYDSFTYNLVQLIEEHGGIAYEVKKYHEVNNEIIKNFDKILLSPGPGFPADFPNLEKWVKEFYKEKSFIGICLGHEAIALAFGAKLKRLGRVFHGVTKKTNILDTKDYFFAGIPDRFEAGLYHSWAIDKIGFPEELKITAIADDGIIMAISHKTYDLKGVQFHPESIMTKEGKKIMGNWLGR